MCMKIFFSGYGFNRKQKNVCQNVKLGANGCYICAFFPPPSHNRYLMTLLRHNQLTVHFLPVETIRIKIK